MRNNMQTTQKERREQEAIKTGNRKKTYSKYISGNKNSNTATRTIQTDLTGRVPLFTFQTAKRLLLLQAPNSFYSFPQIELIKIELSKKSD